ncbi:uncharacterized FAD-linked oxidoreductase ARB_02478 [Physcomitrium patens]|uniref:FAD-binding PCMH-type domain-containing protein n=1 Tax=Physcomitrium patens TaxID=3218 RepID=A0A2K1L198_PHYPA|nr:uncharacterized FAD-linked oxidoreductase ARB_02478-like [Physcomitrium patens]XP_024368149.1 uncharacterized FAD-linked oxidoreductase ARB_02478-like [Physcomitrium patens]XP_024368150.1 uncharacterized FAD-linked oxidoreductase ARB_02478-like [Physcomitrium patens]PNR59795.1 hypothetical protein PHYPA_002587 [Physcomitrium patens]|eukprot:XP_024368148.1 uncharacterized FAD-linked oxidoreductase ARB_02478-like [Physcomitrella patens]
MLTNRVSIYFVFFLAIGAGVSRGDINLCRCVDSKSACWPSPEDWDAFNVTVCGRLILPKPTGSPCHGPHRSATLCQHIRNNWFDAYLRADNAGSMQSENWEDDGQKSCSMYAPESSVCHQGRVPLYGVQVATTRDVQSAVKFAARHKLRVVVKTSGHDFLGRSSAAGSFLIWMHKWKNITIDESFVSCGGERGNPVVKVDGGVAWGEVYDALKGTGWIVLGGMSLTVSATGGFIQGGGHGALGPSFGLGADNVLQMEVVTADGEFRVVNACHDPELFFSLRGGGGGTFGVVVSVTYKLHKNPSNIVGAFLLLSPSNGTSWSVETQEEILTVWSRGTVSLDAALWAGYWGFSSVQFVGELVVPATLAAANATLTPIVRALTQIENVTATYYVMRNHSTFQDWHAADYEVIYPGTLTDYTGHRVLLGSRIIPFSALKHPRRLAKSIVAAMALGGNGAVLGHMVIGPGVRAADPHRQTSVTTAWREGIWHLASWSTWEWNATEVTKLAARNNMKGFVKSLHSAFPNAGAYLNEASIDEPQWQRSFWGYSNYRRLMAVKLRVDPLGLFVCRKCVGSELWKEDGNCNRHY